MGLSAETVRVRLFMAAQLEQLWVQLLDLIRQLQALGGSSAGGGGGSGSWGPGTDGGMADPMQQLGAAEEALHRIELALDALGGCCGRLCAVEHRHVPAVQPSALVRRTSDNSSGFSCHCRPRPLLAGAVWPAECGGLRAAGTVAGRGAARAGASRCAPAWHWALASPRGSGHSMQGCTALLCTAAALHEAAGLLSPDLVTFRRQPGCSRQPGCR